ncbi:hypothetical protein [Brevibacterium sp. XM4083]|uniref:hypothetical protein n=1 Tax=Brevibacterium sp. XM4083 TaxID=2583238 RepID=UPI001125DDAC|nr:hypothetical protein [Brevibacterium sp. XM4083]MCM1011788.1 hypothetical protein [Brevibacterium sp. XM4083]
MKTSLLEPEDFTTSEGLRALLNRLHETGAEAWRSDPVAADLMEHAAAKYAPLARKHGLDPWEAASAAFDVMRTRSARTATDPWGVITHAVRITCIAEERAQGLLCSVHQARRPHVSAFHDPERISDRENPLTDYHEAFHVTDPDPTEDPVEHDENEDRREYDTYTTATSLIEDTVAFVTAMTWPPALARAAVEHVCQELGRAGSRRTAYESLRRDKHAQALLDIEAESWSVLLKAMLGHPHPAYASTNTGRGILLRLLIGETLPILMRDDDLVLTLSLAAPHRRGSH